MKKEFTYLIVTGIFSLSAKSAVINEVSKVNKECIRNLDYIDGRFCSLDLSDEYIIRDKKFSRKESRIIGKKYSSFFNSLATSHERLSYSLQVMEYLKGKEVIRPQLTLISEDSEVSVGAVIEAHNGAGFGIKLSINTGESTDLIKALERDNIELDNVYFYDIKNIFNNIE